MTEFKTNLRILGIIPARGGSKGLPRKNVLPLLGRPLLAYTLEAARGASQIDRIVVSTDDEEIGRIARENGGEVPFKRPRELAEDNSSVISVLIHAIRWLQSSEAYQPDYVLLLQPTSPLREVTDIEMAIQLAADRRADAVVSVCLAHPHPYWMKCVKEDGRLTDFNQWNPVPQRRQELTRAYSLNGAIYLVSTKVLLERQTFYTERTYAYVMPVERSLDIDSEWDFHLAQLILMDRKKHGKC